MDLKGFCGVCLEAPGNFDNCVIFTSAMNMKDFNEEISYLDCFELVTHLKIDINVIQDLCLCLVCRQELENSYNFLRKAEKSQKVLYEKIELEQTRMKIDFNHDIDLNNLIEEIVSDDYSAEPVLTDAMLGTNSTDCFDAFSQNEPPLHCVNSIDNVNLSPLHVHEDHLILADVIISTDDIKLSAPNDDEESLQNEAYGEKYDCSLCPKTFNTRAAIRTHLKYHKRKKTRVPSDACIICEKSFSTANYLRQHIELVHADERQQLKCDQCEKVYFTKSALRNHKRFHTGETINCAECNKSFVTQYDLKIHMRFHARDYPFACTICDKKFAIKGHLSTHMWEHQGLKLQCEICSKLFTSTKALSEHSFVHIGKMPYPCKYCKKSYPSKQKYKVHLKLAHEIEFDEQEHPAVQFIKTTPRRKNLTLVQADGVIKEIEIQDKSENESFNETACCVDEIILEVS